MKPFTLGGIRWWAARGQDADALRPVVAAALAALAAGSAANQKRGRRKALYPLALGAGGRTTHLLKVNSYGARDGLRRRVVASKARRELALAEAVAARGIATPVPIAAGEARSGGRVRACYLLVPFVTGAVDLRRRAAEPLPPAERRALATSFGRFARAIHAAGISQDDFQPNNFLVGPAGSCDLRLIDCERLALRTRVADDTAAWQLAKLEREMPAASLADRARFVAAYAGDASRAGRSARRAIWGRVQAAQPELARHDAERIRRAIRAGGRRFAPLELAGWRGVRAEGAWRDALAPELARALETPPPPGALAAAGESFALGLAPGARAAGERALAAAVLLARRGLAPAPCALLRHARASVLVFAAPRGPTLGTLPAAERRALRPALVALLGRLVAIGRLAAPSASDVGRAERGAPLALALLATSRFEPDGRPSDASRAAARALAAGVSEPREDRGA